MQPNRWRDRRLWLLALFLLGFASELTVPSVCHWWYKPDGEEPFIAEHLYRGHGFSSPLDLTAKAPPSSWSPPVYPVILSIFYHLFGLKSQRLIVALMVLHAAIFGVVTAGLYRLGELVFGRAVGLTAAVAHAAYPGFLHAAADFWDNYPALAIFVWLLVAVALFRRRQATLKNAANLGLGLGVLSLTNASYALAYPLLVLVAAAGRRIPRRLPFIGVAIGCFLLMIGPWTLRNYRTFGRWFYIRDGVKLELFIGNEPTATGWFGHANRVLHPTHNRDEHAALMTLGETAYFDDCLRRFKETYHNDPSAFWHRTAMRAFYCVAGEPVRRARRTSNLAYVRLWIMNNPLNPLLTLMGLAGVVMAWRLRYRAGWIMATGALAVLPYLVTSVYNRYLLPLRLIFLLYAALIPAAIVYHMIYGAWPRPNAVETDLQAHDPIREMATPAAMNNTGSAAPR